MSSVPSGRLLSNAGIVGLIAVSMVASNCGRGTERRIDTIENALECVRDALGGRATLEAVSSLTVVTESTPVEGSGPGRGRGIPTTTEITFGLPDRFKSINRAVFPNGSPWITIRGISGGEPFVATVDSSGVERRLQIDSESQAGFRQQFAQWVFLWLLRDTPEMPLTLALSSASDERLPTIHATGPDHFNLSIQFDVTTCLPVAATWERSPNFGDGMSGRTATNGVHTERRDLFDYEMFDGVRLPTLMRSSTDGVSRSESRVTSVIVNPTLPDDFVPGKDAEPEGMVAW